MGIQEGELEYLQEDQAGDLDPGPLLAPNLLCDLTQISFPFWANQNNKGGNNQNINILGTID